MLNLVIIGTTQKAVNIAIINSKQSVLWQLSQQTIVRHFFKVNFFR